MHATSSGRTGYFFVFLSALFWSMSGNAARFILNGSVSPFQLVQLRTTIASVILVLSLAFFRPALLRIERRDLPYFLVIGSILSAMLFTYLYAISRIPVAAAVLLQYQAPALIAIYSFVFRHENPTTSTAMAIISAFTGCYLMVGAFGFAVSDMDINGIISGIASAVALAAYSLRSEYGMKRYSAWTVLTYALVVSAVIWNIFPSPFSSFKEEYSPFVWGCIIFISIFGTVLPFGLYNEGLRRVHSTHASITATLEPVLAALIAYAVLGELMSPIQLAGGALVIMSVLLLQYDRSRLP